jgi:ATP-dependent Lon protease
VDEIGLFPLPLVLLPTERIPLHVFEPRYRELMDECVETGSDFGLVLEDDDGLREIGTRARVVDVLERLPDGRLNVVVEGGARFAIERETRGRSFRTAEIEPVEDEGSVPEPPERQRAVELYKRLAELAKAESDPPDPESGILSFEIAARIDFGAELKQDLLEARSEPERLERVLDLLERAVETLALQQEMQERAAGNGKVSRPPQLDS